MLKSRITSVAQIDFRQIRFPILAVYEHPDGYPESYIMRVFDCSTPTNILMVKNSLQKINADIAQNTRLVFLNRCKSDPPSMVGTWL